MRDERHTPGSLWPVTPPLRATPRACERYKLFKSSTVRRNIKKKIMRELGEEFGEFMFNRDQVSVLQDEESPGDRWWWRWHWWHNSVSVLSAPDWMDT